MASGQIDSAEHLSRRALVLIGIVALVFGVSFLAKALFLEDPPGDTGFESRDYRRIISMAPSITETLFALGLDDRVVGVTQYCDYPPAALEKTKVGGFLNPNYEAIMGLRPDLVVMLDSEGQSRRVFDKLGVRTLQLYHKDVAGILNSMETLGRTFHAQTEARRITSDIQSRLDRITQKTAGRGRPTVMCAIFRLPLGTGRLEDVCIAGCDGHIDRSIELAGGQNVYRQGTVRFPVVSCEGMIKMNPQVILDMVPDESVRKVADERVLADWQQLPDLEAVRARRVYVVDDNFAFVPGPRFILLVEKLARLIHPEVDWDQ